MVNLNRVHMLIAMGNTYANIPGLREVGAQWYQGERCWKIDIEKHPMNNAKQRKKLEQRLSELEEKGVRFVKYLTDGGIVA